MNSMKWNWNYDIAMDYIHKSEKLGSIMGVDTEHLLLKKLSNPQNKLKVIHIAGTNGKGSVLAMISTVLKKAGYKVGRYISPTLVTYLERFQINGEYMKPEDFGLIMGQVAAAAEDMKTEGLNPPTAFELETAAAFLYFYEQKCDFAVIETGMGGTYDATNVIDKPLCCVLTSIGMDHMGILGSTLNEIAENKAGIIMPETCVISTLQESEAMKVILDKCDATGSRLVISDYTKDAQAVEYGDLFQNVYTEYHHERIGHVRLSLNGTYQIINSCLAISCLETLRDMGYNITNEDIIDGIAETRWFGRLSHVGNTPPFFVDGAHNEPAARVLASSVKEYFSPDKLAGRRLVYIMGVFADKDYNSIIGLMAPMAEHIFTIATPDNARAMSSEELATRLQEYHKDKNFAESCSSITEAVNKAVNYNDGNVVVLAFGSLSHLNTIREAYEEWIKRK